MLKSVKITNFSSIATPQELSFSILDKDVLDNSARQTPFGPINTVGCIVGHNASGKTNALKAISTLFALIQKSYLESSAHKLLSVYPHKLRRNEPITFEIEFLDGEKFYNYRISFGETKILYEHLKTKNVQMRDVFKIERKGDEILFESKIEINEADLTRFKERATVPMLSSLISTGYFPELKFFEKFHTNIDIGGFNYESAFGKFLKASQLLYADETVRSSVLDFTKAIDIGISDFSFFEVLTRSRNDQEVKEQFLECLHKSEKHKFDLPLYQESGGTQHAITILTHISPILKEGGLVILDEMETALHPIVVKKIIGLFENTETNPQHAQLIFSTHQHLLLNDRTKTQIFIAEKTTDKFETELFRLDDIEGVRNDENYFHKYIAGAYGGTPRINWV